MIFGVYDKSDFIKTFKVFKAKIKAKKINNFLGLKKFTEQYVKSSTSMAIKVWHTNLPLTRS